MQFRTFDGADNSRAHPDFNATGSALTRIADARYADGVSTLVGGPNPRTISNLVVGEGDPAVGNLEGVSGMMYAWGQFVDHDISVTVPDGTTRVDVQVPDGDPDLPANGVIPLTRVETDPDSGTGSGNPTIAVNAVTGWEDASMVYGSDAATAARLRLADGHLKTSAGDNLPIADGQFLAGDSRAAENPSLTALQTLFVREHNHQVDRLKREDPDLTGDELYDQARAIVTAEIARITHNEFLPHLLGPGALSKYDGYDPSVDPRITAEFAGAAFRFGHSMVSAETERLGEGGQVVGPASELRDTFFMPPGEFAAHSGADGFLRHLASDLSQAMDARIVEDLRNFLFDPPVASDLAAINIQRGRDMGLETLNGTREALGMEPYDDFADITDDAATVEALKRAFKTVDEVDLWTGGLSEGHADGAVVGPTFQRIIADQFEALRDGDRFWYQNQGFDAETLEEIENTTLADIILRNTDTEHIQDDVFVFVERRPNDAEPDRPDAPQLVIGTKAGVALTGGAKDDILVAEQDKQTMTGRDGRDLFVFTEPGQHATITDFEPGRDRLSFDAETEVDVADLEVRTEQGHALVVVGEHRIELLGVRADQVTGSSFITGV
ncbi:MAG TPA: peroxidase family protein [Azospirillum sp.]|nr:peroxidase family protein [Azospirillum sp.]